MTEEAAPPRATPMAGNRGHWRLILGDGTGQTSPTRHCGAHNMAVDQALLDSVADGAAPVLRLYRWSPATLSFGRNQPARGLYDEDAAADNGIGLVRRPTGGQAVFHDDELTYAVVAPVGVLGKPRRAYRWINEVLVAGLRELGVEAGAVLDGGGSEQGEGAGPPVAVRDASSWAEACFRRPERGEVVVGGRKLVGSAQRTQSRTILQHGSILLGGTQAPAEELLCSACRAGATPASGGGDMGWTTLAAELGHGVPADRVAAVVVSAFEDALGITLARSTLAPEEGADAAALRVRFESRAWTWRR